jgi:hypothetical protein
MFKTLIDFNNPGSARDRLPDHMHEGMENYLLHGVSPGGFMTSVLENNLFLAAKKADHVNITELGRIANWISNDAPPGSWGSCEQVRSWMNDVDGRRSRYAKGIEQRAIIDILSDTK